MAALDEYPRQQAQRMVDQARTPGAPQAPRLAAQSSSSGATTASTAKKGQRQGATRFLVRCATDDGASKSAPRNLVGDFATALQDDGLISDPLPPAKQAPAGPAETTAPDFWGNMQSMLDRQRDGITEDRRGEMQAQETRVGDEGGLGEGHPGLSGGGQEGAAGGDGQIEVGPRRPVAAGPATARAPAGDGRPDVHEQWFLQEGAKG